MTTIHSDAFKTATTPIYATLMSALRVRRGDMLDLDETIDDAAGEMRQALQDITDGEWNGMSLDDVHNPPQINERLKSALQPILDLAIATMETRKRSDNWQGIKIQDQDRERFGRKSEIDLDAVQVKLVDLINEWITFLEEHPNMAPDPEMPLAVNHVARDFNNDEGISRLQEVVSFNAEGKYYTTPWVTNSAAAQHEANLALK